MGRFAGILGIVAILCIAYLCSTNRRMIRIRTLAWGLGLQFAFALLVLKTPAGKVATVISSGSSGLISILVIACRPPG